MQERSDSNLRNKIIGLDEKFSVKSYYPQFKDKIRALEESKKYLEEKSAALLNILEDLQEERNKVEASQIKLKSYFDNSPGGIIILNNKFEIFEANKTFLNQVEFQVPVNGRSFIEFVTNDYVNLYNSFCENLLRDRRANCQISLQNNGKYTYVFIEAIMINDDEVMFLSKDITKDLRLQREKENLFQELQVKNKELESIVYVASHDLRTPLVNIMGFSQRLKSLLGKIFEKHDDINNTNVNASVEEDYSKILHFLDTIYNNGTRMDSLISGLLKISRAGRSLIELSQVNVSLQVEKILISYYQKKVISDNNVILKELPDCYCDPNQLYDLFNNLIDNAIRFSRKENIHIEIGGDSTADFTHYYIKDNGIGIPEENIEKIWEIFYQVEHHSAPGQGIGLTLCKRIVDKHNGKIWAESTVNKGSTFHVQFPNKL